MDKKIKIRSILAILFYFLAMVIVPLLVLIPKLTSLEFVEYSEIVNYLDYQDNLKMLLTTDIVTIVGVGLLIGKNAYHNHSKMNIKKVINYLFKFTIISFLIDLLVQSIVIRFFPDVSSSNNQLLLIQLFKQSPILMGLSITVLGPVIEELIFRYAIFNLFKNRKIAIIVSSIIFGLMHVDLVIPDIFFIVIYCCLGYMLGKIYEETKDLRYSTLVHVIYNAFETLLILI